MGEQAGHEPEALLKRVAGMELGGHLTLLSLHTTPCTSSSGPSSREGLVAVIVHNALNGASGSWYSSSNRRFTAAGRRGELFFFAPGKISVSLTT